MEGLSTAGGPFRQSRTIRRGMFDVAQYVSAQKKVALVEALL
jgi:hypothetical protein